jgi:hypothetical protein
LKKIITISFLLLLLSQAGYYLIYTFQQWQAKEAMEARLRGSIPLSLTEIIESCSDIVWEEAGKEFYLHGQLYDVVTIKKEKGKIFLYCLSDKKEGSLLKDFCSKVKKDNGSDSGNKNGKHIVKFQLTDFTLNNTGLPRVNNCTQQFCTAGPVPTTSFKKTTDGPPPKASLFL